MLQPLELLDQLIEVYPALGPCRKSILDAYTMMETCYQNGGKVLLCGNGGSSADCDHIVGELMKGFHLKRPMTGIEKRAFTDQGSEGQVLCQKLQRGLPAISLNTQSALISAFANDVDAAMVYAQQVFVMAKPGDVLVGLSTSGNAKNVAYAAVAAKACEMKVIGFTGEGGGRLSELSDVCVKVPHGETYCIQELHLPVYHALCAMIESRFFGDGE